MLQFYFFYFELLTVLKKDSCKINIFLVKIIIYLFVSFFIGPHLNFYLIKYHFFKFKCRNLTKIYIFKMILVNNLKLKKKIFKKQSLLFLNPQYNLIEKRKGIYIRKYNQRCKLIIYEPVSNTIWTTILKANQEWETLLITRKTSQALLWSNLNWAVKTHSQRNRPIMTQPQLKKTIQATWTKNPYFQMAFTQLIQIKTLTEMQLSKISIKISKIIKMVKLPSKNRSSTLLEICLISAKE